MSRRGRFGVLVMAAAMVVATAFAGDVTVGRFYTELAKAKQLGATSAAGAESALRAAGFKLPKLGLDKSLTEGDMTSIANVVGITVTTSRPAQAVGEAQLNTFMSQFGSQLGAAPLRGGTPFEAASVEGDPGNSGNGKGKKKGHEKSTSEPN